MGLLRERPESLRETQALVRDPCDQLPGEHASFLAGAAARKEALGARRRAFYSADRSAAAARLMGQDYAGRVGAHGHCVSLPLADAVALIVAPGDVGHRRTDPATRVRVR